MPFRMFHEICQEIAFREQLRYPPVTRMVCLTARGRNPDKVAFFLASGLYVRFCEKL